MKSRYLYLVLGGLMLVGLVLQLHNVRLFNPLYGFDGKGHIEYFEYLRSYHHPPLPHEGWQMYQSPLYYLIGYPLFLWGGPALVQYENVAWYLVFTLLGGYLIARLLDRKPVTWILATLSLLALPVVNYLVPMISNEYMNDVVMGITLLTICLIPTVATRYRRSMIGLSLLLLIIGFYTKYTVLTLAPAYAAALWLSQTGPHKIRDYLSSLIVGLAIFLVLTLPITLRNIYYYRTPLAMAEQFFPFPPGSEPRDLNFFTNLGWIGKLDLFQAHHYSFTGGTWNTFWHDGYQATVPVVTMHKKALVLWALGFLLAPLSLYGYFLLWSKKRELVIVMMTYTSTAFLAYILYNLHLPYPSELKAFFMSALPVVYATGITATMVYRPKWRVYVALLLLLQFGVMLSYFWIMPWWFMVK